MGAERIDIDTQAGHVSFVLPQPVRIDFAAVEKAAHDAGYSLRELELQVRGRTVSRECESCEDDVLALEIPQTRQVLELIGTVPVDEELLVVASVSGWAGGHPRLTVLEAQEP